MADVSRLGRLGLLGQFEHKGHPTAIDPTQLDAQGINVTRQVETPTYHLVVL